MYNTHTLQTNEHKRFHTYTELHENTYCIYIFFLAEANNSKVEETIVVYVRFEQEKKVSLYTVHRKKCTIEWRIIYRKEKR